METRHVYGVSPWRRRLLYGIWALFAVPLTVGGLVSGEAALLTTAAIFTAIALPIFVWALRTARLTVTPDRIELRQAGGTLETSWSNVEQIRLVRGAEGFVLREPMQGRGADRFATTSQVVIRGAPLYDPYRRQLLAERRFIPIEAFSYWLTHGDLRQVLSARAPDLVRQGDLTAADERRARKGSTGRILLVSAIVLAAGSAGVLAATHSDVGPVVTRVVLSAVALAVAVLAVRNALSAVSLFRSRQYGSALLWCAVAVLQVLLVLACLAEITGSR